MSLTPAQFEYFRYLVRTRCGIELDEQKRYLIDSRLQPLAHDEGCATVAEYVARLPMLPPGPLHQRAVEAMATRETSFFRDGTPFDILQRHVLPELIRKRAPTRTISIWSAACSTGQEPYSIALLLHEHFPELRNWNVRILASDFSPEAVERTSAGRYFGLEVTRGLPPASLQRWFRSDKNCWELQPEVRRAVECRQLNLMEPWPALAPMDVIFLRNVLIYFHSDAKRQVLERVRRVLRPDGYLFLGGAETTLGIDDAFEPVSFERGSCYRLKK